MATNDLRAYCIANNIPSMSVSITVQDGKKKPIMPSSWNDKINASNYKQFIDETQNGYAVLTGRRIGSNKRIVCIDTDNKKAEKVKKTIDRDFVKLLERECEYIESTPGGKHYYFMLDDSQDDLMKQTDLIYNNIKMQFVDLLANNAACICSPTRYSLNGELKEYKAVKGTPDDIGFMSEDLYNGLIPKHIDDTNDAEDINPDDAVSLEAFEFVKDIITKLSPEIAKSYDTWFRVGLIIKKIFAEEGYELFEE